MDELQSEFFGVQLLSRKDIPKHIGWGQNRRWPGFFGVQLLSRKDIPKHIGWGQNRRWPGGGNPLPHGCHLNPPCWEEDCWRKTVLLPAFQGCKNSTSTAPLKCWRKSGCSLWWRRTRPRSILTWPWMVLWHQSWPWSWPAKSLMPPCYKFTPTGKVLKKKPRRQQRSITRLIHPGTTDQICYDSHCQKSLPNFWRVTIVLPATRLLYAVFYLVLYGCEHC